ncbi:uncharacterized protein N7469_000342 [Penicillium citrinum]|uniref:SMP domain-containing protein n=1 Tax=Penicillium citrinum TaxID=5077 RepID=A0A9W9PCI9_PENCI|nr:uncharacterized protein N7469_000342 [Penicillium citrinum]KAJ5242015.1 hypothetical protein N7469_000342 [Penicillium citrinum]
MSPTDATMIQAADAKAGNDMNRFPARAQVAAAKNTKSESSSPGFSGNGTAAGPNDGMKKSPASSGRISDKK